MTKALILADYVAGGTTAAEFDYMDGVTSNVQTQLDAKLALAGGTMTGDLVPATPLSHRNMIINGAMNVAQRGGSGTGVGYTCADRFQRVADNNGGVTTARVSEGPAGFENSYKVTITTADTSITSTQYEFHEQQIEGSNIYHLEWGTSDAKTVTLSFYVRSSLAGVFGGSIRNSANNRAYSFEYTIDTADTWERKTITIAGDTTGTWLKSNLAGLKIEWALGSGSSFHGSAGWSAGHFLTKDVARSNDSADALLATVNATWQITGVQLELGSSATPFEVRSYTDEELRCHRYYVKWGNTGWMACAGSGSNYANGARLELTVPMRANGSISLTGNILNQVDSASTYTTTSPDLAGLAIGIAYLQANGVVFNVSGLTANSTVDNTPGIMSFGAGEISAEL